MARDAFAPLTGDVSAGEADRCVVYHSGVADKREKREGLARSLRERGLVRSPAQEKVNEGLFVPGIGVGGRALRAGWSGRVAIPSPIGGVGVYRVPKVFEGVLRNPVVKTVITNAGRAAGDTAVGPLVTPFVNAGVYRSLDPFRLPESAGSWVRGKLGIDD